MVLNFKGYYSEKNKTILNTKFYSKHETERLLDEVCNYPAGPISN
jgi:hypothetical protein